MEGFLLGYGFVIPLALWISIPLIEWLDIRNVTYRLACGSVPITMTLKCLEAMYGFTPYQATQTLGDYLLYVGFILRPKYDRTTNLPLRRTWSSLFQTLQRHFLGLFMFSILYQMMDPYDFFPFSPPLAVSNLLDNTRNYNLVTFQVGQLYNTFLQASEW